MHAASLSSPRLQRVLKVLEGGRAQSTRDIVRRGKVMAVSAIISELRQHGAEINCTVEVKGDGQRRYLYTMTKAPKT